MRLTTVAVSLLLTSSLAAQDMPLRRILIPGEGWRLVAEGMKFSEGPACDARGRLYFTDVADSKIHRLGPNGPEVFIGDSAGTNGLMFDHRGRLLACRNGKKEIVSFNDKGRPEIIARNVRSNDIVVNRRGDIYFTDPSNKRVWFVPKGGKPKLVDEGIGFPNGLILWPDGRTLVVADSRGPHLWAFRVEDNGLLTFKQPYSTMRLLPGRKESGADGMTVDQAGRLYVATHAGVQVFDTQGRLSGVLLKPQRKFLSNVVFGGPDFDTLFVTCSDKVYARKLKTRGFSVVRPK